MNLQQIAEMAATAAAVRTYSNTNFPPSLYYKFLRLLAANIKPSLSIELGVCGGGGSLHLALGWPQGSVIGVDKSLDYGENIGHIKATCPNFRFLLADSVDYACRLANGTVDILFIDTVHTYERTIAEFRAWQPKLVPGAVVCLDDLFRDGMQQAWDELPGEKMRLDFLHIGGSPTDGGFGVILL